MLDAYQLGEEIVGSATEKVHFFHNLEEHVFGDGGLDGFGQRRHGVLLLEAVRLELELHVGEHLFMELQQQLVPGHIKLNSLHHKQS